MWLLTCEYFPKEFTNKCRFGATRFWNEMVGYPQFLTMKSTALQSKSEKDLLYGQGGACMGIFKKIKRSLLTCLPLRDDKSKRDRKIRACSSFFFSRHFLLTPLSRLLELSCFVLPLIARLSAAKPLASWVRNQQLFRPSLSGQTVIWFIFFSISLGLNLIVFYQTSQSSSNC